MFPKDAYKYCLKCGGNLVPEEGNFLTCEKCGFHVFINSSACVGAIIENENGEILLTIRGHEPGKGEVDIPGGFIEPYEDAKTALKRELQEELGVDSEIGDLVGTYYTDYLYQEIKIPLINLIYATKIHGTPQPNDDVAEYYYVSKDTVFEKDIWDPAIRRSLEDYLKAS